MDTSGVSAALSGLASGQTAAAAGILVLKKALDAQAQNAAQLLAALPEPARASNPPGVGGQVDTFA